MASTYYFYAMLNQYDELEDFVNGVAAARIDEHYGLIDQAGNTILPFEFDSIFTYRGGWVHARKNKTEYLYTSRGEEVLQISDIIYWYPPEEGLIRVKKDTGWGCINMQGQTIIPFQYISLGPCQNGWLSFYENGKWGWLDKQGKVVVPPAFLYVGNWSEQLWWARDNNNYALYDYSGNIVVNEGWLKLLLPHNGVAAAKTAEGWKYIDENFSTILQLPPVYEWVEQFIEGLAAVKRSGLWGFIDASGKEVITPAYQNVSVFRNGLAAVQKNDLWGYIDLKGNVVIPFVYHGAGAFNGGKARVCDTWWEWYIDQNGNEVSERKYLYD